MRHASLGPSRRAACPSRARGLRAAAPVLARASSPTRTTKQQPAQPRKTVSGTRTASGKAATTSGRGGGAAAATTTSSRRKAAEQQQRQEPGQRRGRCGVARWASRCEPIPAHATLFGTGQEPVRCGLAVRAGHERAPPVCPSNPPSALDACPPPPTAASTSISRASPSPSAPFLSVRPWSTRWGPPLFDRLSNGSQGPLQIPPGNGP
jgi:hypothetical protein